MIKVSDKILMTLEGLEELRKELVYLKTDKRGEIAEKIRIARGFGDLSENSEYDEAKNEQGVVEARISVLEEQLKKVKVLDVSSLSDDMVNIGNTVTIKDIEFDEQMTYKIVTSIEANHSTDDTISDESPVGKALLGHKVGDKVEAHLPNGGKAQFEILDIAL